MKNGRPRSLSFFISPGVAPAKRKHYKLIVNS